MDKGNLLDAYTRILENPIAKYFSLIIIFYIFFYSLIKINSDKPRDQIIVNKTRQIYLH